MKITGTILEAGYHLDADGIIPRVTIGATNDDELLGWDGQMYGRRVIVVDETDYDAHEKELAETVGELQVLRAQWQRLVESIAGQAKAGKGAKE